MRITFDGDPEEDDVIILGFNRHSDSISIEGRRGTDWCIANWCIAKIKGNTISFNEDGCNQLGLKIIAAKKEK